MHTFELMDHEQEELLLLLREKYRAEELLAQTMPGDSEHGYHARMCVRLLELLKPRTATRQNREIPKAIPVMPARTAVAQGTSLTLESTT